MGVKRFGLLAGCFLLLGASGFAQDLEATKRAGLASARAYFQTPEYDTIFQNLTDGCVPKTERLYAGKPLFIRSLIHPNQNDIERLRKRIADERRREPEFLGTPDDGVSLVLENNRDTYRVPIFDRTCGYLFHTEPRPNPYTPLVVGRFQPLSAVKARHYLGTSKPPELVRVYAAATLTPEFDGYFWVAGSRAVQAFSRPTLFSITDGSGQAVSPLETTLEPQVVREPFVTTDGRPSAFWYFRLPVRSEPLN